MAQRTPGPRGSIAASQPVSLARNVVQGVAAVEDASVLVTIAL